MIPRLHRVIAKPFARRDVNTLVSSRSRNSCEHCSSKPRIGHINCLDLIGPPVAGPRCNVYRQPAAAQICIAASPPSPGRQVSPLSSLFDSLDSRRDRSGSGTINHPAHAAPAVVRGDVASAPAPHQRGHASELDRGHVLRAGQPPEAGVVRRDLAELGPLVTPNYESRLKDWVRPEGDLADATSLRPGGRRK